MGLFSCNCECCEHPLLSDMAVNSTNAWMNEAVAIQPDNEVIYGPYDGYGRIGDSDDNVIDGATCYHYACWTQRGRPRLYGGPSEPSDDQGWFFEDDAHDMPDPRGVRT